MLQSPGVKQPHDPGDWASYLLARRRCTSPRTPSRARSCGRHPPAATHRAPSRIARIKAEAVGPEDPW
jgi:hypothetical protein